MQSAFRSSLNNAVSQGKLNMCGEDGINYKWDTFANLLESLYFISIFAKYISIHPLLFSIGIKYKFSEKKKHSAIYYLLFCPILLRVAINLCPVYLVIPVPGGLTQQLHLVRITADSSSSICLSFHLVLISVTHKKS